MAQVPTPAGNTVIWVKAVTVAVPMAVLSLTSLGEKIVLLSLVLGSVTVIWRQAVKPIVTGARKIAATYELAEKYLPVLVDRVDRIETKFEALERVGEIVDLARDEHVQAMRQALDRVRGVDPPQ